MKPPVQKARKPTVDAEDLFAATETALFIVEAAAQSRASLIQKLVKRGYAQETAEKAVVSLTEMGAVDDARYARSVAKRRLAKGYGHHYILAELHSKGVEKDLNAEILEDLSEEDIISSAVNVLSRTNIHRNETKEHYKNRLRASLSRRGFSFSQIKQAEEILGSSLTDEEYADG